MTSEPARLLVVDDDDGVRAVATEVFRRAGYDVSAASSGQQAAALLEEGDFVAAVVDLVLPDTSGLQVLEQVREANPETVMVVITGYASLDSAMEAVRLGAYDYLRKPFTAEDLLRVVQQGVNEWQLVRQNRQLLAELDRANRELVQYRDRLESHLQVTSEKLEAFIELGKRLAGSEGAMPGLADVLNAAMQVAGAASSAVFTTEEDGFCAVVAAGEACEDLQDLHLRPDEAAFAMAAETGQPSVIADLLAPPSEGRGDLCLLGLASAIVLPLQYQGVVVGVMALFDWQTAGFAEAHLDLLRVLVAHAADLMVAGQIRGRATAAQRAETQHSEADDQFVDLTEMLGREDSDGR